MNAIEAYFAEEEEQGIKKGIKKGEKKGLHNKNVQAIQKMLEKELPVSLITEVLSVTKIFVDGVIAGTIKEME